MSVPEVRHRLYEHWLRRRGRSYRPQSPSTVHLYPLPGIYADLQHTPLTPAVHSTLQKVADAVNKGQYTFLGVSWPHQGKTPDWHLDPNTEQRWPASTYCFAIDYRHSGNLGDIKHAWELSRLQYLQPVALLAAQTQDAALARICATHLLDWIQNNPPYQGIHWNSGIELALRAISMGVVTSLLGNLLPASAQQQIAASLYAHGCWIARFPSRFSSANNHAIAEAAGLFVIGHLLHIKTWQDSGRATLEREILQQIHVDGVGAEQSPTYTAFSLEMMTFCAQLARATAVSFSNTFLERLHLAGKTLRTFVDSGGNVPRIGDDDEGRVLLTTWHEPDYVLSVLAILAAFFQDGHLMPPRYITDLRTTLAGSLPDAIPMSDGVYHYPDGGYTVVHGRNSQKKPYMLVMDHAPLGYLSIAAHGHADTLSIWLHVDGEPVLVDAGTYLYHAGGQWREYFRGTSAHNTLSIMEENSSTTAGAFNWSTKASCRLHYIDTTSTAWKIAASHNGYVPRFGVEHLRTVRYNSVDQIVIEDTLPGAKDPLAVTLSLHLHPSCVVHTENPADTIIYGARDTPVLRIATEDSVPWKCQQDGWYAGSFGQKQPCSILKKAADMQPGILIKTTITVL